MTDNKKEANKIFSKTPLMAAENDEYAKVAAWFLGPKAENSSLMNSLLSQCIIDHETFRKESYKKTDEPYIDDNIKSMQPYIDAVAKVSSVISDLSKRLQGSEPFFSPRYMAHMNWDTALPANIGYFAAMMYNQNNVATEASPVTSVLEKEVGEQLCKMLGFPDNDSWGHITADGSIANLEAMWVARNLKLYPLALQKMLNDQSILSPVRDTITVPVYWSSDPQIFSTLTSWDLLNLDGDVIVDLPENIAVKAFPDKSLDEALAIINNLLANYTVQNLGLLAFTAQHPEITGMKIFVPATRHYSWPKAATILGLGQDSVIGIPVNNNCQMNTDDLKDQLQQALDLKQSVIMTTAVLGSTEEGAVDNLQLILELRNQFRVQGLNFNVHCDAAWGGYLTSMLWDEYDEPVLLDEDGYVPIIPLSLHAQSQFMTIPLSDTLTIDPHKAGFIPYPAGSLCYRNGKMKGLITFDATYIHSAEGASMGIFGVEGSKPGAAPAAVWAAHKAIGLNQEGYGRILGECMFSTKIYYCNWITLATDQDDFKIEPMVPLPDFVYGLGGKVLAKGEAAIKDYIRRNIVGKSNEEISQNYNAMMVIRQVGPDVLINAISVNYKTDNIVWNQDIDKCNRLNQLIFEKFSMLDKPKPDIDLILTSSELGSKEYGAPLSRVLRDLHLPEPNCAYSIKFLINTILQPWPTTHGFVKSITDAFRKGVEEAIEIVKNEPDSTVAAVSTKIDETIDLVTEIPANLANTRNLPLNVKSYSGYIPVEASTDNNLFYWFFESRNLRPELSPEQIPLVIWLNGGPGASSLTGLFLENGPFRILNDTQGTVIPNPAGWNEDVHLIYWDQPVGTGYSTTDDGYVTDEEELSQQMLTAMLGFYELHPEYKTNPLFITGESYAGKYIPFISRRIIEYNQQTEEKINLSGIALGDGWMNPQLQTQEQIDYAFAMGFVDTKQKSIAETKYNNFCESIEHGRMKLANELGNDVTNTLLKCGGNPDVYDVRRWSDAPIDTLQAYLGTDAVKDALHVPREVQWQFADNAGPVSDNLINDIMADMTNLFPELLNSGLKILFYTGNFDMACGFTGTEKIVFDIAWPYQKEWQILDRKVWVSDGENPQTQGYIKQLHNLMQVNIPDAGHLVPISKPVISREMIYKWIYNEEFNAYNPLA